MYIDKNSTYLCMALDSKKEIHRIRTESGESCKFSGPCLLVEFPSRLLSTSRK